MLRGSLPKKNDLWAGGWISENANSKGEKFENF